MGDGLTLNPQAQLTWADVQMDRFIAPGGTVIDAGTNDSLRMRLGLVAERSWNTTPGADARVYALANLTHDFKWTSRVVAGTTPLDVAVPDWTGEIDLGASYGWGTGRARSSVFGEVTATRALSGGSLTGVAGSIGLHGTW